MPQVPYIYFADNDVAQSSVSTARSIERSERRVFPEGFETIPVNETGELMTQSLVHGDILLWVVHVFLWRGEGDSCVRVVRISYYNFINPLAGRLI